MPNQHLLKAAATGDVPAIERALAAGADVETRDARGRTPVLLATDGNHVAAARALMDSDLDAEAIARKAMAIAADICVYTNGNVTVEALDA